MFLSHLCHQNKEYSKQIAKLILKGIHQGASDELAPILHIMKKYLSIEDDLKELRCEWIFGIANFEKSSWTATVSFMIAGIVTTNIVYRVIA